MKTSFLAASALVLSLAAGAALAQSGGAMGTGSVGAPRTGTGVPAINMGTGAASGVNDPPGGIGSTLGSSTTSPGMIGSSSPGMSSPNGSSESLGIMPSGSPSSPGIGVPTSPDENTLSTPNQAPSGTTVPGASGSSMP